MKTAIIGGGAAGFFCAINLKEMVASMQVTIFERANRVLSKVEMSGGGRCNCTNTFLDVTDLSQVYPRGHRLLKRLFNVFDQHDAYEWFERHGVPLTTQDDQCVFPRSQDARTIINMFLAEARRLDIKVMTGHTITSLDELADYDCIVATTGGQPRREGLEWWCQSIVPPVPSLFSFRIDDHALQSLMGIVVETATAFVPGTKMRADGPLLITHWGMSGPAILRLSSYAARLLAENNYQLPLGVNWTSLTEDEVRMELESICARHAKRLIRTHHAFDLNARLWEYLTAKCLAEKAGARWLDLGKKDLNRLVNVLTNDQYQIAGRTPFKDEFVTCGGIDLAAVNPNTLESKTRPGLYFAGELLDIDGVTGGFNFQAAWTTAYTVAKSISQVFKS